MSVDEKFPWWEIKQFQAHSSRNGDTESKWHERPPLVCLCKLGERVNTPHDELEGSYHYVSRHVVSVVEFDEGKIRNVSQEERDTDWGENETGGFSGVSIESEDSDSGKKETVEHRQTGREVVELLGHGEIAGMEHGAPDPWVHSHQRKSNVVGD